MLIALSNLDWFNGKHILEVAYGVSFYKLEWNNGKELLQLTHNNSYTYPIYVANLTWETARPVIEFQYNYGSSEEDIPLDETNLLDKGLSSNQIDNRLIYLAGIPTINALIDIRGNEPRTSASDAAVLTLVGNGCQIREDL